MKQKIWKRLLAGLLCAAVLFTCVPVTAAAEESGAVILSEEEEAGTFWLTASTQQATLIRPAKVSYTSGQTVREALQASSYSFEGIDTGFVSEIEGVSGNFLIYFSDGDYDLDRPAYEIQTVVFTENQEGYSPEAVRLIETLGACEARTDHAQNYAPVEKAVDAALSVLRKGTAEEAQEALESLEAALAEYEELFADDKKVPVQITARQGEEILEAPEVVLEDSFGNRTEVTGTIVRVAPGTYDFQVSDGSWNYTKGTITVEEQQEDTKEPAALEVELPSGEWFGDICLSDINKTPFVSVQDKEKHTAEFWIPDTNKLVDSVYIYAEKGSSLPLNENGTAKAKLYACYYDERFDKDMGEGNNSRSWESASSSLTGFVQEGMEGKELRLEARDTDENGYEKVQFYTLTITRVPTLSGLKVTDSQGSSLLADFTPEEKEYTLSTVSSFVEIQADAFGTEGYSVSLDAGETDPEYPDRVFLKEEENIIHVKVSHVNGQSSIYQLTVEKKEPAKVTLSMEEGVTAEICNRNGSVILPVEGNCYELIPGEIYTYTSTINEHYHAEAQFEAAEGMTVPVATPLVEEGLTDFAVYNASNKATRLEYEADAEFSASRYAYSYLVPDANTAAYVQATPADGYTAWADYTGRSLSASSTNNGKEYHTQLKYPVSAAGSCQSLTALLVKSGYASELTVKVQKTADIDGIAVTYYQNYEITLRKALHLSSFTAETNGEAVTFLDEEGNSLEFDRDITDYYIKVASDTLVLQGQAKFMNDGDPLDVCWNGGYWLTLNDRVCEDAASLEFSLDSTKEEEVFVLEVGHEDENAEKISYRLHVIKVHPVTVRFEVSPQDAIVFVKSNLDGRILKGEKQGNARVYEMFPGQTYTWQVTCSGYQGVRETDYIPQVSETLAIKLKAAPVNPSLKEVDAEWPTFLANENNNNVISAPTPVKEDEAVLYWAAKLGEAAGSTTPSQPILVGDYLYSHGGNKLYKIHTLTGEVQENPGQMDRASSFAINPPTYAEGMIFVGLANGGVQAFDAATLESLWIYNDDLKGQPNSTLVYHDGYLYTGFWQGETKDANFVCLTVTDEDPAQTMEEKIPCWTYTQSGGFYWAGAYVTDDFLLVGTDDGDSGYTKECAYLLSLDPKSGEVLDRLQLPHPGDLRSSITYDAEGTKDYYFTTKGGYFYRISVNSDGTFKENSLKWIQLENGTSTPAMSTSTPTVNNGRAYVGVSGSGQFSPYSGHNITVLDLASMTIAYRIPTQGYPQSTGVLTTAYEEEEGKVYVYFFDNYTPGKLRMLSDRPGQTAPAETSLETYTSGGTEITIDTAYNLWTPSGAQQQYALATPIVDSYGTFYIKNDSGYLMAVGSTIEKLEITRQPDKTAYAIGESFDPTGMQVTAVYSNGKTRDVTDLITYSREPLTEEDTRLQLTYETVLYQNQNGAAGAVYTAPSVSVSITVTDISGVSALIDAIGSPVTLADEEKIKEARAAYDALDETIQELISGYQKLEEAEEALALLKRGIEAVTANINAIGDVTLDKESAIKTAEREYSRLTDEQKALVTNYTELEKARQELNALLEQAKNQLEELKLVLPGLTEREDDTKLLTLERLWNEKTGTYEPVEICASLQAVPAGAPIILEDVLWTLNGTAVDSGLFTFTDAGEYIIQAAYGKQSDSVTVIVSDEERREKTEYLKTDCVFPYFKNKTSSLDVGDILPDLREGLLTGEAEGGSGELKLKDAGGNVISENTSLAKLFGKKTELTLTAEYWLVHTDGEGALIRQLADSTVFTITYDNIRFTEIESLNGVTLSSATQKDTSYDEQTVLTPVFSYNGNRLTIQEAESYGFDYTVAVKASNERILKAVVDQEEKEAAVSGLLPGTASVTMHVVLSWKDTENKEQTEALGSRRLKLKVTGERLVKEIQIR